MSGSNRARGIYGETLVARWYEQRGYVVIERNWRDGRRGEIDLLLGRSDGLVVFCEVKARASEAFGHPFDAITPAKLTRLRRLAGAWIAAHPGKARSFRLDAAAVLGSSVEVRHDIG